MSRAATRPELSGMWSMRTPITSGEMRDCETARLRSAWCPCLVEQRDQAKHDADGTVEVWASSVVCFHDA